MSPPSITFTKRFFKYATTNYIDYPFYEREGVMRGRMVITHAAGADTGTLELNYTSRISGLGGFTFDGHWTAVEATGVFKGIKARGTFISDHVNNIPPTLSGTYN